MSREAVPFLVNQKAAVDLVKFDGIPSPIFSAMSVVAIGWMDQDAMQLLWSSVQATLC